MNIFEQDNFITEFFTAADSFIKREKARQQRLAELEENYFFEKDGDDDE